MHVYVLSDGELFAIVALTALIAFVVGRLWAMRRVATEARRRGDAAASLVGPVEEENRTLRALVERQERRLQSLEAIATDPAERTARAIEQLRVG